MSGAVTSIATAIHLLIRGMTFLPQHLSQRLLLFRIDRQQLPAEVRVLSIAIDARLALGDGVIEHHEFFLVADQQRGRRILELRCRDFLEDPSSPLLVSYKEKLMMLDDAIAE